MFNSVLWSGTHLPLPEVSESTPQRSNDWEPLFGSRVGIPVFWWFLLDRFNCFWRASGAPIFIVDRTSALARGDQRFAMLKEVLDEQQQLAWQAFRNGLQGGSGEIFSVELSDFWRERFSSGTERFEAYMKRCSMPFEASSAAWRKLDQDQKQLLCSTLFCNTDTTEETLTGISLTTLSK